MFHVHRILCPIDFSECSRHALDHAVVMAGWYDAELTALYVEQPLVIPPILATAAPVPPPNIQHEHVGGLLQTWLEPATRRGLKTTVEFAEGTPDYQILKRAASLQADLIVLGTHGRSGFDRLLLGSVTEKVLRKARCPVLTVPPPAAATSTLPFKRLICPVDFSEPSIAALRVAESIAQESQARLEIVHAIEWPEQRALLADRTFDAPEYRAQVEARVRQQLEALVPPEVRTWCEPVLTFAYGKPYRTILDLAARTQADLIVMGVHGRNALDLWLFGSTTNHVVRRATCPVLTLRGSDR